MLWAVPGADTEDAQTTVTINVGDASALRAHAWDALHTGASMVIDAAGGQVTLDLTGTPQVFVQEP